VGVSRFDPPVERPVDTGDPSHLRFGRSGIDPEALQVLADRALKSAEPSLNLALDLAVASDNTGHEGHTTTGTSPSP
jgi:hypothetical protein